MSEKKKRKNTDLIGAEDASEEVELSDEELEDALAEINPYYAKVSSLYSTVRYLIFFVLILLVTLTSIRNPDSITYDNFMFLVKDFTSVIETGFGHFESFTYNPNANLSLSAFRNNMAQASSSGLRIYSGSGRLIFEDKTKFGSPHVKVSDRYLLLYDFEGRTFSLYNSFARIYSENLEYDIVGGDVSNSGMFALVSKTKEYNSAVLLYGKNCKLKNRYLLEERVIDVSINDAGDRICIVAFSAENSAFVTKIMISKPGESAALAELKLNDVFPLACEFTHDGRLVVFCDKAIYFYDAKGNLIGNYTVTDEIEAAKITKYGAAISSSKNAVTTESTVTVLGTDGNILYSGSSEGRTLDIFYEDGYLFILSDDYVSRTEVANGKTVKKEIPGGASTMAVYSKDDVMICSSSKAEYYDFSK